MYFTAFSHNVLLKLVCMNFILVIFPSSHRWPCFCSWCPAMPTQLSVRPSSMKTVTRVRRCSVHSVLRGHTCPRPALAPKTRCVCLVPRNTLHSSGTFFPSVCTAPTSAREHEWLKSSARPRTTESASVKRVTTGRITSVSHTHSVPLGWVPKLSVITHREKNTQPRSEE